MVQPVVEGVLLFHVEHDHRHDDPHDDHHALILKLRGLRGLRLEHAAIGRIRPIYRLYSTPSKVTYAPYQFLIEVTADSQEFLHDAFERIDQKIHCHVDGFGF